MWGNLLGLALVVWTEVGSSGATFDREAGRLRASGQAAADFTLPTVAVIRQRAGRLARERAEKKLTDAIRALKSTAKGTFDVQQAKMIDQQFGSDGSVELTLELTMTTTPPTTMKAEPGVTR